ncbi:hypothetical protein [Paenibacillus segetis]|uniref:Group-specific protein n=1 Tax=Paenibacillus segetis TaxID=1325360 RepID=A0ABQ1YSA1_9BACL|nr:hypothetical protein [Paenibacillus segetis]GGH36940.1 hypothetical protein GCM10008013_44100 [Paenibacillus segetis]
MFHPTVFDNIKVAIENQIYDYDNLDGILVVTDRSDLVNMALMSREFTLSFKLIGGQKVTAEIVLSASTKDLNDEILEVPNQNPGCNLQLRFYTQVENVAIQCQAIKSILHAIWGSDLRPLQALSFIYGEESEVYNNCIELQFKRQITEEQMEDIPELLKHVLQSAEELESV